MAGPTVYSPDPDARLVERAATDFGVFAYDGFGIMLSSEQLAAYHEIGVPGPRREEQGEAKFNWLSGGQRGGKTVLGALMHARAALYKEGVDPLDRIYWRNYLYGTLNIAPSEELSLRLWTIMSEISKGANDAQHGHPRGAWIKKLALGKSGQWGICRYSNGAVTDFRSSEGKAYRLEGGQWWFFTWDEWASQPDAEIGTVLRDVLLGRSRDHNAKIVPMAWPKPETERHLMAVIEAVEAGTDTESRIVYLSAESAYFTNRAALKAERKVKTPAEWKRTVLGRPAGGGHKEFKVHLVEHAKVLGAELGAREDGFSYLTSWDLGMANDSTVGLTWRIPIVGGRRLVTPEHRARIVDAVELLGSDDRELTDLERAIRKQHYAFPGASAVDATAMGGVAAFRGLRDLKPRVYAFTSKAQHRVYGNMREAAITNGVDMLSWGRPDDLTVEIHETTRRLSQEAGREPPPALVWGCVEIPIQLRKLLAQLGYFDRDAKNTPDDWTWAFLIGCWYIRRWWTVGQPNAYRQHDFDVRTGTAAAPRRVRTPLVRGHLTSDATSRVESGIRYIVPPR